MKPIISFVMNILGIWFEEFVTCADCRNVSLNDRKIEDVYTEMHYLKEVEYFYCNKQKRYVKLSDLSCGECEKR